VIRAIFTEVGVVAYVRKPSTWEFDAGGSLVGG
jgi:hypothetical protein